MLYSAKSRPVTMTAFLWASWTCLLFSIVISYALLMDKEAWRVYFVQYDDETAQNRPTPWHKSKIMLYVIRVLLVFSAFFLLMHFVVPKGGEETPKTPEKPVPANILNNTTNKTFLR